MVSVVDSIDGWRISARFIHSWQGGSKSPQANRSKLMAYTEAGRDLAVKNLVSM